jgi:serine/threonine protein kinase
MNRLVADGNETLSLLARVDAVCLRFEDRWQAGERPAVEEFLAQVPEADRAELLGELLLLEWSYRRRRGESFSFEDYAERFPSLRPPVEQAWQRWMERGERDRTTDLSTPTEDGPARLFGETGAVGLPGYERVSPLGQGGMADVFKAFDPRLKRWVALKQVRLDRVRDDRLGRFRVEAEALAKLQHPHIVKVHEYVERDGRPVLVMEYVGGGTLEEPLRGGPLPPPEAARLVAILAWAVHAAHEKGIVHRDLKPANVLMDEPVEGSADNVLGGYPKVSDFGLAALAGELLVGNFGDGRINVFDPTSNAFLGQLADASGVPVTIEGLWGLRFGNNGSAGGSSTLFFTAGINGEMDGLLGSLTAGASFHDFTATITWGDGHTSRGTVAANGGGVFTVSASNTYMASGSFAVSVLVQDAGGSSVTLNTTAAVSGNAVVSGANNQDNTLTVMRTPGGPAGALTYVLNNAAPVSLTGVTNFTYLGGSGNDTFTLSFANGAPQVLGGAFDYDGGGGANRLVVDESASSAGDVIGISPGVIFSSVSNYAVFYGDSRGGDFSGGALVRGSSADDSFFVNRPDLMSGLPLVINASSGNNLVDFSEAGRTAGDVIGVMPHQIVSTTSGFVIGFAGIFSRGVYLNFRRFY